MPDEVPPTSQTVENGDIPAPLSNLMRFVSIQVKKLQAEATGKSDEKTKKLHGEVTSRLQDILLDFGFGEQTVERVGSEFGGEVIQLSGEAIPQIETSIRLAYEKCLGELSNDTDSQSIVLKKVNSRSDLRLVFNTLRTSTDFGNLRERRIWMLPVLELKNTLEKTFCGNGAHWYKMILMALRFCEEEKTISSYDISAEGLRHFLCDYVFCVPREEFVGKPHTGRRPGPKTRTSKKRSPTISEVETPKTRKPRAKQNDFPKHPPDISQHMHLLTPRELQIFRLFYGYVPDKHAYIIGFRKTLHQICVILGNLTYASVYLPFRRCLDKLSVKPEAPLGDKPVQKKPGRKPKDQGIVVSEVLPALLDPSPSENISTEKPVILVPKSPKVSLAGVVIPDELPDVSGVGGLPTAMREIFQLYYGYAGGDMTNPSSYEVSKRMTREQIAQARQINKLSVYQTLQKTILRLKTAVVSEIQTTESPPDGNSVTVHDDMKVVLETVPEPVSAKPSAPLPERIRPTHTEIPESETETYENLIAWVRQPGQSKLVRSLQDALEWSKKEHQGLPHKITEKILARYTVGSIEFQLLLLAIHLNPSKNFRLFVEELKVPKEGPKTVKANVPTTRENRPHRPSPASSSIPARTPPITTEPILTHPATKPVYIFFGISFPEIATYDDFILFAKDKDAIVMPLITFYTTFKSSPGNKMKEPGIFDIRKTFQDGSDGWKLLVCGSKLRHQLDITQVLLDICDIKSEPVPVVILAPKAAQPTVVKKNPPVSQIPKVEKNTEEQILDLLIVIEENKVGMKMLRSIADDYISRRFQQAQELYEQLQSSRDTDLMGIWKALCELQKLKQITGKKPSIWSLILEVCNHEFLEDPELDYITEHEWAPRVRDCLQNMEIEFEEEKITLNAEVMKDWLEIRQLSDLTNRLRSVRFHVPLGKRKWYKWQEKVALETTLFQFLEDLLEFQHKGQTRTAGFDIHEYKKLMRQIKFPESQPA